jgi:hypothetical protein
MFTPFSYAKPLHIRRNVRFKACVKSRYRRRMKNDRNPRWLRQIPLRLYVSAICFFASRGPGDFNIVFGFLGAHLAACYRSLAGWPRRSPAALLPYGSFGEHPPFDWPSGTPLLAFGAPWDLHRPPFAGKLI